LEAALFINFFDEDEEEDADDAKTVLTRWHLRIRSAGIAFAITEARPVGAWITFKGAAANIFSMLSFLSQEPGYDKRMEMEGS